MTERWIIAGVIAATSLYALRGFWSEWRGKSATDPYARRVDTASGWVSSQRS